VAGNSLGGLVALELAKRGLVRSATGLSPAGFANRPETLLAQAELRVAARSARGLTGHLKPLAVRPRGRKLLLGAFVARPERVTPHDTVESARALARAPWFDETLGALAPGGFTGGDDIRVPVTIAWGERDYLLLPRQAQRAKRLIPRARLVSLPGCGHVPTYDDPERVAQVLLEGGAAG
jgi:pimeloyl-ACP methyl ester carboxylesterase